MVPKQQTAARGVEHGSGPDVVIALDVGERRIGVAMATVGVWIASPHGAIVNDQTVWDSLSALITDYSATHIVVGLPRNLSGDETSQTAYARAFAAQVTQHTSLPVVLQDEALTSRRAEEELRARNKPYAKGDIDALAATYILEDYIKDLGT